MKIGVKLGLGFGAILLIILLSILAVMPSLEKADQGSMAVADHYLDYAFQADNLEKSLLRMQLTFPTAATAHDHEGVYQKKLDELKAIFLKDIAKFKDMFRRMDNAESARQVLGTDAADAGFQPAGQGRPKPRVEGTTNTLEARCRIFGAYLPPSG
ncbi:hypothetical protein [Desulfocurvibacter africanus]|uniref:hypothetical protein n=1 Tax=Desulfocurvibacter africanus TaxID=873 RepID=UPI00041249E1|nr:hypothetical protein [Desulfocurvibacter africanus]